jgi:hypothetical protein
MSTTDKKTKNELEEQQEAVFIVFLELATIGISPETMIPLCQPHELFYARPHLAVERRHGFNRASNS